MSDSESDVAGAHENSAPSTPGEVVKEIFVRILAGLGAVGRGFRGGFVATATCVQQTVYPMKEGCIYGYDQVNSYLHPPTTRGGGIMPAEDVVHFTQMQSTSGDGDAFSEKSDT